MSGVDPFEGVKDLDPFAGVKDADPFAGVKDAERADVEFGGGWDPVDPVHFKAKVKEVPATLHRLMLEGRMNVTEARQTLVDNGWTRRALPDDTDFGGAADFAREFEAPKTEGDPEAVRAWAVPKPVFERNAGFFQSPGNVKAGALRMAPMGLAAVATAATATGVGAPVGLPMLGALGAAGVAGEGAAQLDEVHRGVRQDASVGGLVVSAPLAMIPGAKLSPLQGTSYGTTMAIRAGEGAVMSGAGSVVRQAVDAGHVDAREVAAESLFGGLFGAGAGLLETAVTRALYARAAAKAGVTPQEVAAGVQARHDAEAEAVRLARERAAVDPRFAGVTNFDELEALAKKPQAEAAAAAKAKEEAEFAAARKVADSAASQTVDVDAAPGVDVSSSASERGHVSSAPEAPTRAPDLNPDAPFTLRPGEPLAPAVRPSPEAPAAPVVNVTGNREVPAVPAQDDPFAGVRDATPQERHEQAVDAEVDAEVEAMSRAEEAAASVDADRAEVDAVAHEAATEGLDVFVGTLPKDGVGRIAWGKLTPKQMAGAEDFPELHGELGREYDRRMAEGDAGPTFRDLMEDGALRAPSARAESVGGAKGDALVSEVEAIMGDAGVKTEPGALALYNRLAKTKDGRGKTVEEALAMARNAGFDIDREEFMERLRDVLGGGDGGYPTAAAGVLSDRRQADPAPRVSSVPRDDARRFLTSAPVASIRGDEVPHFGSTKALKAWVIEYYAQHFGGGVESPDLGRVLLDGRAVHDSAGHGLGKAKVQAFALVPDIIAKGKVVADWPDRSGIPGAHVYIVAAPVRIGSDTFAGVALLKTSVKDRRLYVHEVLNEGLLGRLAFKTGLSAAGEVHADTKDLGVINKVIGEILGVKPSSGDLPIPPSESGLYWRSEYGFKPVDAVSLPEWKAARLPNLVRFWKELTGMVPDVRKMSEKKRGFYSPGTGRIAINRTTAFKPETALFVMAHEIGHGVDYAQFGKIVGKDKYGKAVREGAVGSGNLLGRLAVLADFRRTALPVFPGTMPTLVKPVRDKLKVAAAAELRDSGMPEPEKGTADHAEWLVARNERYQALVAKRVQGDLALHGEIREELLELSGKMRPWQKGADAGYDAYRGSADELYADFFAAVLASPATALEHAPLGWRMFFDHLDRKPDAARALLEMQALLQGGDKAAQALATDMDALKGYGRADAVFMAQHLRRERLLGGAPENVLGRLQSELLEAASPAIRRYLDGKAEGLVPSGAKDFRLLFGELTLADNEVHGFLSDFHRSVLAPLDAAGVNWHDLGLYMQHMRVLKGDRAREVVEELEAAELDESGEVTREAVTKTSFDDKLFNPGGVQVKDARLQVSELLRRQPNREARVALIRAQREMRRIWEGVVDQAVACGIFEAGAVEKMRAGARGFYAPFVVVDYFTGSVASTMRAQGGTFKEVANPALAMVLKAVTTVRAAQLNKAKVEAMLTLSKVNPDEWKPVKRKTNFSPFPEPANRQDEALFVVRWGGKPEAYHIPRELAEVFERAPGASVSVVTQSLNYLFQNFFHPNFIQYSPTFTVRGAERDMGRAFTNMPTWKGKGAVMWSIVRNFMSGWFGMPLDEAGGLARKYLAGEYDPVLADMLAARAISPPHELYAAGGRIFHPGDDGEAVNALLQRHAVTGKPHEKHDLYRKLGGYVFMGRLMDHIGFVNETNESVAKLKAWMYLTRELGWPKDKAAGFVRDMIGVPNTLAAGAHLKVAGAAMQYVRVAVRGWHQDFALMTGDSPYAGLPGMEPVGKVAAGSMLAARVAARAASGASVGAAWFGLGLVFAAGVMVALAEAGLFGEEVKRLYRRLPEYQKQSRMQLPVGSVGYGASEQTVAVPFAMDDTQRLFFGAGRFLALAATGQRTWSEAGNAAANTAGGMIPGPNALIKQVGAWASYATGNAPRDENGRAILNEAEMKAGGTPGLARMTLWSLDQFGVPTKVLTGRQEVEGDLSGVARLPIVKGFVTISNAGEFESMEREKDRADEATNYVRARRPDNARALMAERTMLQGVKGQLEPELKARLNRLNRWHEQTLVRCEDQAVTLRRIGSSPADALKELEVRTDEWRKLNKP